MIFRLRYESGDQKTYVLISNIIASLAGRGLNLFVTYANIPIALAALGPSNYAVISIVLSYVVVLAFADLGLGASLVREISKNANQNDDSISRNALSQIFHFIVSISVLLIILSILIKTGILKFTPFGGRDGIYIDRNIFSLVLASIAIGLPAGLAQRLFLGMQLGVMAQIWMIVGRLSTLILSLIGYYNDYGLLYFVFSFVTIPVIVNLLSLGFVLLHLRPQLRFSLGSVNWTGFAGRLGVGLSFFVLQLLNYVEYGVDVIFLAGAHSAEAIVSYDLVSRVFMLIPSLSAIGMVPIWPAIASSISSGDRKWVRKTVMISFSIFVGVIVSASVVLNIFCEIVVFQWTGHHLYQDEFLVYGWTIMAAFLSFNIYIAMVLNGLGIINLQLYIGLIFIPIILLLKYYFVESDYVSSILLACVILYPLKISILGWAMIRKMREYQ